jgi:hypothetical protein
LQAELIALRVTHHDVVIAELGTLVDLDRAEIHKSLDLSVDTPATDFWFGPSFTAAVHVKVHAVLGRLRLGHALDVEPVYRALQTPRPSPW